MADETHDTVTVRLSKEKTVVLRNDTPDIDSLVQAINEMGENLAIDEIKAESSNGDFDSESFTQVVREVISDYLLEITIDKNKYDAAIDRLQSRTRETI